MSSGKVIDAADLYPTRLDARRYSAFIRTVDQDVAIRHDEGWQPHRRATIYWNDTPSGNGHADFADGCGPHYLQCIIEAMIHDAVVRRAKGGKRSRRLPPAVDGFLFELSQQLCSGIH
jgi:hypothetical protein